MKPERSINNLSEAAAERIEDVRSRAGDYLQARMTDVSARAQSLARDADQHVEQLTGRDLESWTSEARTFVRQHPLQAIAVTIGIGYVLGKMMARD